MSELRIKLTAGQLHTLRRINGNRAEINAAVSATAIAHANAVDAARKHLATLAANERAVAQAAIAEAAAGGAVQVPDSPVQIDGDEIVIQVEEKQDA